MNPMRDYIDGLIEKWIMGLPNAPQAYREDPLFHYQVEWIRTMMIALDGLMAEQGLIERSRRKLFARLVLAGPDASAALMRLRQRQDFADTLMRQAYGQPRPTVWQIP